MAQYQAYGENGILPQNVQDVELLQQHLQWQSSAPELGADGQQLRIRPFSLEEALPFTPFTSVFPFDSGKCTFGFPAWFLLPEHAFSMVSFLLLPLLQWKLYSLTSLHYTPNTSQSSCAINIYNSDFCPCIKISSVIPLSAQGLLRFRSRTVFLKKITMR